MLNHDNPHFTARTRCWTQNWLQANCPGFIEKNEWPPNSSLLKPLGHHVWGAILETYLKTPVTLGWLVSWKLSFRPFGKSCHKNTSTRRWQTSSSAWVLDPLRGCQWWSLRASAATLSISKSPPTNRLFTEPPTHYRGRQRSERWEMGRLRWSWIILSIPHRLFLQNWTTTRRNELCVVF